MSGNQLAGQIVRLLQDQPSYREPLTRMVAWHESATDEALGFTWKQAQVLPATMNKLIVAGVVTAAYESRKYTFYRLADVEETKLALDADATPPPDETIDVDGLFSLVIGHDRLKNLLRYSISAADPVHVLLIGAPGSAKSLILSDVARLPGAVLYAASSMTRAGLLDLLLQTRPKFLLLDELDKIETERDASPLLSLLESGLVTRLIHGHREQVEMPTRVIAAVNATARLSSPLLSRFAKVNLPPYSDEEYVQVVKGALQQQMGCGPNFGELIARSLLPHSKDIRDAIRVARMAGNDPARVPEIVATLWPPVRSNVRMVR